MNHLLQVKLRFSNEKNSQKPGGRNLKTAAFTSVEKVEALMESLRAVKRFYAASPKIVSNLLIDVYYNDIIAKSGRIQALLKPTGKATNDMVVGARFSNAREGKENHIITYYVDLATVDRTIHELEVVKRFLYDRFNGKATAKKL